MSGLIIGSNTKLHTMKLKGSIQGVPILMLVDNRATDNFISQILVRAIGWKMAHTVSLPVNMGDGFKAQTRRGCRYIIVEVGKVKFNITTLLFDLNDIDVVLGMAWLTKLGDMWVD